MTKRLTTSIILACLLACFSSSCASGPNRLSRTWDNYVNQKYTESSLVHGALLQDIIPVYGIVGLVMGIGDGLFVNPYYFWTKDVWDGTGTGYTHENPLDAEKTVTGYAD